MDGDVRLWDLANRRTAASLRGHRGAVRGVAIAPDGLHALSCGDDCTIRLWSMPASEMGNHAGSSDGGAAQQEAVTVFQGRNSFRAVDHRSKGSTFVTAGAQVDVWDQNRSEPVQTFSWGADTVVSVRCNPAEPDIFASTASDRSIALYDMRMGTPLRKLVMQTRTNAVAWNPREPFNFVAANEDCRCYTYDMRKLKTALCVHEDHVSAVMDVDFSPTGREFVTGSYDRTVRIFPYNGGHSREVYHTKRMQRVFSVRFSGDATYVLSGSDDTNIRLWKAKASQQMGVLLPREKKKQAYMEAIKNRYKHLPEIKRIDRHRHLPKPIYKVEKLRHTMRDAERAKDARRREHSAPGSVPHPPARKKRIVAELE
eukprot:SM000004S15014  [mRNA]  locus=s4:716811:720366:- [translate_table: standard]